MNNILFLFLSSLLVISCSNSFVSGEQNNNEEIIEKVSQQAEFSIILNNSNSGELNFPRSLDENGEIRFVGKKDWTSGFYPGILWLVYELSGKETLKTEATYYTDLLETEKFNASNHDIGFKMMSSYGNAYRLTGNSEYRKILIQAARTLITRFNENVGCIRSWDHHKEKWSYPVIIDNMMNLELLFWATRETGDPVFWNIAEKHAETTMKNHFRKDFSTYHVLSYDTVTADVIAKNTYQGYRDESCWSRGEAWALYGYTMVYRETRNPMYLKQAENIAKYLLNRPGMKEGKIPTWDFNVSETNEPYDASAGAIIASALFELSKYSESKEVYIQAADKLFSTLSSAQFSANVGEYKGFLLKHSTGSKPSGTEVDVPLIYADYYYLEALKRKIEIDKTVNKISK